jgi:hypothetical protein
VQAGTVLTRAVSGATTAGVGNPIVSTVEWVASLVLAVLAVVVPVLAAIAAVGIVVVIVRKWTRWRARRAVVSTA